MLERLKVQDRKLLTWSIAIAACLAPASAFAQRAGGTTPQGAAGPATYKPQQNSTPRQNFTPRQDRAVSLPVDRGTPNRSVSATPNPIFEGRMQREAGVPRNAGRETEARGDRPNSAAFVERTTPSQTTGAATPTTQSVSPSNTPPNQAYWQGGSGPWGYGRPYAPWGWGGYGAPYGPWGWGYGRIYAPWWGYGRPYAPWGYGYGYGYGYPYPYRPGAYAPYPGYGYGYGYGYGWGQGGVYGPAGAVVPPTYGGWGYYPAPTGGAAPAYRGWASPSR
jgi:hypothetical protein